MKVQKTQTVKITKLSHDGRGIGHIEGKTLFVSGAMVNETVQVTIQRRKNQYEEGVVESILIPSPHREKPLCESFEICGGCSLQHMDKMSQIHYKQAVLIEQLQHIGKVVPKSVLSPLMDESYGYRRKARLGVRYVIKKEKLLIGFREKNGRYLADIEFCPVLHKSVGQKLPLIKNFLLQLANYTQIPQLEIAVGDDATAIIIRHLTPLPAHDLQVIKQFAIEEGYHIYLQPSGPDSAWLFYPENAEPRLSYRLEEYGLTMRFHPTDFIQVNQAINVKLINQAMELLAPKKNERILDLFCGIGNFTLPIATLCAEVVGVEGSLEMVARGNENAVFNHIANAVFKCEDLSETASDCKWLTKFDGVLIDPPRTGAIEIIKRLSANRIVYVSCNPATLARDAGQLSMQGYELTAVGVLDMFPHTSHVESIALFTRV